MLTLLNILLFVINAGFAIAGVVQGRSSGLDACSAFVAGGIGVFTLEQIYEWWQERKAKSVQSL